MPLTWTRIEEGDSLSNTALENNFTSVKDEINALESSSLQLRSLHHKHLPSSVISSATESLGFTLHTYTNEYPGYGDDTITSGGSASGWKVIQTGGKLLRAYLGTAVDFSDSKTAGCLIMANIQLNKIEDSDATPAPRTDYYAMFKIQVYIEDTASWASVERTERYADSETKANTTANQVNTYKDISLRVFVNETGDVDFGGGTKISAARVLVSVAKPSGITATPEVSLQHANLSIIGLYGTATAL